MASRKPHSPAKRPSAPPNIYHAPRSTNYINYPVNENLRNILFWLDLRLSFKVFLLCAVGLTLVVLYFGVGFIMQFMSQFDEEALLEQQSHCYVLIGVQGTEALRQGKCLGRFLSQIPLAGKLHVDDASNAHHNEASHQTSTLDDIAMSSDVLDVLESVVDKDAAKTQPHSPHTEHPHESDQDLFIVTEVSKAFYKEYIWRQLHSVPQPRRKDPFLYRIWMKWFNYVQFFRADASYHNEEIGDEEIIIQQDVLQDVHETVQRHPAFVYMMPSCNERRKEIVGGVSEFARLIQQNLHNSVDVFKVCSVPE